MLRARLCWRVLRHTLPIRTRTREFTKHPHVPCTLENLRPNKTKTNDARSNAIAQACLLRASFTAGNTVEDQESRTPPRLLLRAANAERAEASSALGATAGERVGRCLSWEPAGGRPAAMFTNPISVGGKKPFQKAHKNAPQDDAYQGRLRWLGLILELDFPGE